MANKETCKAKKRTSNILHDQRHLLEIYICLVSVLDNHFLGQVAGHSEAELRALLLNIDLLLPPQKVETAT